MVKGGAGPSSAGLGGKPSVLPATSATVSPVLARYWFTGWRVEDLMGFPGVSDV